MTIRTGKSGRYRYYTCSTKARQGPTACSGMTVPMKKLDDLVADHLEERLLDPARLKEILATVLDRRQERSARRCGHIAELKKRATEADLRLKSLYDAIESGVADLEDPDLKERIANLKALRNKARVDADRASNLLENGGKQAITPPMLREFAGTARQRIRLPGGGYRRDHLRALAQRVEVAEGEVRITGSRNDLLRTLAKENLEGTAGAVPCFVPSWRSGWACRLTFSAPEVIDIIYSRDGLNRRPPRTRLAANEGTCGPAVRSIDPNLPHRNAWTLSPPSCALALPA